MSASSCPIPAPDWRRVSLQVKNIQVQNVQSQVLAWRQHRGRSRLGPTVISSAFWEEKKKQGEGKQHKFIFLFPVRFVRFIVYYTRRQLREYLTKASIVKIIIKTHYWFFGCVVFFANWGQRREITDSKKFMAFFIYM